MPDLPYAARYLVPYLRLFPIWRYGERYSKFDGRRIEDGWYPVIFGEREVSRAEALRLVESSDRSGTFPVSRPDV